MHPYTKRRELLKERYSEKKIEGFLTFDRQDVFYLTGFPVEGAFLLVSQSGSELFAPLLLGEQAKALLKEDLEITVRYQGSLLKALSKTIGKNHLRRLGYDAAKVPVSLFQELARIRKVKWRALAGFVLKQRTIKEADEIEAISRACQISIHSYQSCWKNLKEGESEADAGQFLEQLFYKNGSPKPGFETIIAFGENSAYPHHLVSEKKLNKNEVVLMDLGATVKGYHSDLTRTDFFGKITSQFKKIYRIVEKSQQAGIAALREGVPAGRIDFICREVIRKEGYGDYFVHGSGHGLGLEIHEPPRLGMRSKEILKAGMVVTVEPGIYLPGKFGVRIEDTLLVTKTGCKILTSNDHNI